MSDGWRSMDSAPKDGTAIWLWCGDEAYIGYCEPAGLFGPASWFVKATVRRRERPYVDDIVGCYAFDVQPEMWMPLPDPPTPSEDTSPGMRETPEESKNG